MLYTSSASREVRGGSTDPRFAAATFSLDDTRVPSLNKNGENEWLAYLSQQGQPQPHWLNYVKASVYFALGRFGEDVLNGFDFAVDSNIPAGSGASSSSALVVLAGAAVRSVNHISFTPEELANESAMAEWFIGTRGGSMDHLTICLAQPANAVLISYANGTIKRVRIPDEPFQWITFFSKPADKGREVMIEYNERAAVARLLIPNLIDRWRQNNSEHDAQWLQALALLKAGSMEMLDVAEAVLNQLPETITLELLERDYPDAFLELERSFPDLSNDKSRWPLLIRARALHHLGEMKRVAIASHTLSSVELNSTPEDELIAMTTIGELLNESNASLRDLYGVSTNEVEHLISIIRSDPNVLGVRIMGGGFGGNVLALTTRPNAKTLIERVQAKYYAAQNRNGIGEGSIMVSTPGPGLSHVDLNDLWRESISHINTLGDRAADYSGNIRSLLDSLPNNRSTDIWPVVVAAGKGTRAVAGGLTVPKPVASVLNQPAILHVLRNIQTALGKTKPPIVIISPETENAVRNALAGEEVLFVVQEEALGTGDAVLNAHEQLADFDGRTLVVWSTQPVIQPDTFARAVRLAALFDTSQMVLPTTFKQRPYAPITRSESGDVRSAVETHLERANLIDCGETNIGLFLLDNRAMFDVLLDLKRRYWIEESRRYNRPSGELGFPNELINAFAKHENGVLASPFADSREEQGIKHLDDLTRCEQFIMELESVNRRA